MDKDTSNLDKSATPYSSFSTGAKKLLMQTLTNWTMTQEVAHNQLSLLNSTPLTHHSFVTLTLPYTQMHCDKVIKRECLNNFLIYIKRAHNASNYLWKAEVQRNGNIHFHILFDKYIPWREVRNIWNRSVNRLGYVDWFCTENDSLDPNSTDIHSLKKVKNIRSYIAKYVSKQIEGRNICGHAWGRSENLSKLKPLVIHNDWEATQWLKNLKRENRNTVYSNEHVGITKFDHAPNLLTLPYFHCKQVMDTIKKNLHVINKLA